MPGSPRPSPLRLCRADAHGGGARRGWCAPIHGLCARAAAALTSCAEPPHREHSSRPPLSRGRRRGPRRGTPGRVTHVRPPSSPAAPPGYLPSGCRGRRVRRGRCVRSCGRCGRGGRRPGGQEERGSPKIVQQHPQQPTAGTREVGDGGATLPSGKRGVGSRPSPRRDGACGRRLQAAPGPVRLRSPPRSCVRRQGVAGANAGHKAGALGQQGWQSTGWAPEEAKSVSTKICILVFASVHYAWFGSGAEMPHNCFMFERRVLSVLATCLRLIDQSKSD